MITSKNYVREAPHGALKVGESDVSLDSVVYAYRDGHSPEMIVRQYPALTLEEAYGAIAFYLANREFVHEHLARQDKRWEELRRKSEEQPSPVVQRLRALKAKREQEGG
jgi:uncharacterized protein (DUF433 family)